MDQKKPFKILSIDGGGIKGLYSSKIIEHLEEKYQCNMSDYFDMICGTSTGGLIALALSLKISAREVSGFYEKHGRAIFPHRTWLGGKLRQALWGGKYTDKGLRLALQEIFGDKRIQDSQNLLCIPAYSVTDGRPWVFKYDHKEGQLSRDNKALYTDVALATTAAPTYFPLCTIDYYDNRQFIDGGVWANNPALVGLVEALAYFAGTDKQYDSIQILSISSLNANPGKALGLNRHRSFIKWQEDLFETFLIGHSGFSEYVATILGRVNHMNVEYVRIPSENVSARQQRFVKLDLANRNALQFIRSKGNDRGELARKDPAIAKFFINKKHYQL